MNKKERLARCLNTRTIDIFELDLLMNDNFEDVSSPEFEIL